VGVEKLRFLKKDCAKVKLWNHHVVRYDHLSSENWKVNGGGSKGGGGG
jgi:hypothetical protein